MARVSFETLFVDSLATVLTAAGHPALARDALQVARSFLATLADSAGVRPRVTSALKLTKDEYSHFIAEVERFAALRQQVAVGGDAVMQRDAEIAQLRVLAWFESIRTRPGALALPDGGPAMADHLSAFRLLSALEMSMRALMRDLHRSSDAAAARLRQVLPAAAADAIKRNPQDPVAGLFLKDLIALFVDGVEWQRIDPLYSEAPFLTLLRSRRETAERFLEDIRRIRNTVAHLGRLTAVQEELLHRYYQELIEPVKESFAAGRTGVDPSRYESPGAEALKLYGDAVLRETARELRSTRRGVFLSLGISAALLLLALPVLLPMLQLKLDPDAAYLDALERQPRDLGSLTVQACEQAHLGALARLAARDSFNKAMTGYDAEPLHARIMTMAAQEPQRLRPCVAIFVRMGWDPNRIGGNTAGSLFGGDTTAIPSSQPAAYLGFLRAHSKGLLAAPDAAPTEVRCPALVYAVWNDDFPLAKALKTAGARAETRCLLGRIWIGRTGDIPLMSALDEASRLGRTDWLALLSSR